MADYKTMEIRALYRSHSHLPIWEVMDKAGIWEQVGLKVSFEFCDSSEAAEKALFNSDVDFVSGNHISPYLLVRRGQPIVSLTSPSNSVDDRLVTRFPVKAVSELKGKRIGDIFKHHLDEVILHERKKTAYVSGSPKRQLYSSTFGPSLVSISPA